MSEKGKVITWVLVGVVFALIMGFVVPAAQFYKTPPKSKTTAPRATAAPKYTIHMQEFPVEVESTGGGRLVSKHKITDVRCEWSKSGNTLYFYVTGERTYSDNEPGASTIEYFAFKLYDAEGYVVDSGIQSTPSLATGEKFRDEKIYIWSMEPGEYTFEIVDYTIW